VGVFFLFLPKKQLKGIFANLLHFAFNPSKILEKDSLIFINHSKKHDEAQLLNDSVYEQPLSIFSVKNMKL